MRAPQVACWLVIALAALQLAHAWAVLPDTVASHFGSGGRADGFSSKAIYVMIMGLSIAVTGFIFLAIAPAIRAVPPEWLSVPNRDYWLNDERRADTLLEMGDSMAWFGVVTLVLLVVVNHLVIGAHQLSEPRLDERSMWAVMVVYLLITAFWVVRIVRRYTRVPGGATPTRPA